AGNRRVPQLRFRDRGPLQGAGRRTRFWPGPRGNLRQARGV
ncbi:MAG: hypothetical protein AVDCRST_MAG28-311, partial [uncultured Rubrobacteraceae bacterium]